MNLFILIVSKTNALLSKIYTVICKYKSGLSVGKNTKIFFRSQLFFRGGVIEIGKNVLIGRSRYGYHASMPFYTTLFVESGGKVTIGNNTRVNGAYIHARNSISIGNNCLFASGINLLDCNGHETYSIDRTKGTDTAEPIVLGNNVWVGINSTILKGTKIGDNCIVAAGSVVKGNFPANVIIQGNPAKIVKEISLETI